MDITDQSEPTATNTPNIRSLFVTHFWISPNQVEMVFTLLTYPLGMSGRYIGHNMWLLGKWMYVDD
jgi:hypothetical protein